MCKAPLNIIHEYCHAGAALRERFVKESANKLNDAAIQAASRLAAGKKLLFCGNGGSAADSQHLAAEFVNKFCIERPALPAIALTTDSSILTAVGNDLSFDQIFSRQIEGLGNAGDMLVAISTSGESSNVLNAIECARQKEIFTVFLTGKWQEAFTSLGGIVISVPSTVTSLIQEMHIMAGHLFCRLTDYYLFENPSCLCAREKDKFNKGTHNANI